MVKVDLKSKPYNLSDEDIAWVKETISGMSIEEDWSIIINLFFFGNDEYSGNNLTNKELLEKYHIGGARYKGGPAEKVQNLLNELQSIQIFHYYAATAMQVVTVHVTMVLMWLLAQCVKLQEMNKFHYDAGYVSGREESALGVNWNLIHVSISLKLEKYNCQHSAYGTTAETVIKHTNLYLRGLQKAILYHVLNTGLAMVPKNVTST